MSATLTISDPRPALAGVHDSEIDRRENLSYREFVHEHQIPRRPCVITDATRHWGARSWTPQYLQRLIGRRGIKFRGATRVWPFDELMDAILNGSEDRPAPYARNLDVARDLPELLADITPRLGYAQPDWKSSRLLPRDLLFPNGLEEMFIGGPGTRFPYLHVDYYGMDGFISQLYGDKEFLMFDPADTPYLYPDAQDPLKSTVTDLDHPDYERYPLLARARPIRFVLRAGETLYQPNGWWHTTRMLGVSIAVITATWNASNWATLVQEVRRRTLEKKARGARLKAAFYCAYLRGVGALLGARERITRQGSGAPR